VDSSAQSENAHRVFALRLARVATLTALGVSDKHYGERLLARQIDWVTCLVNAGMENLTFDLRLICEPNAADFMRGRLEIALLCRLKESDETVAGEFARGLKSLCEAYFENEYEFELVTDARELERLRAPFEIGALAEIMRRAEYLTLDTLQRSEKKRAPGFISRKQAKAEVECGSLLSLASAPDALFSDARRVYHIYPFLFNAASETTLFRLLLRQSAPLALSIRLRPTALNAAEQALLEEQIARCERYAQLSLGQASEDIEALAPTLQQQARLLQQRFVKNLYALKDNAALLRVEAATAAKVIPQVVIDAVGAALSLPAGGCAGAPQSLETFLSGGYEFSECQTDALAARAKGFRELAFTLGADERAPTPANRLRYLFDAIEAAAIFRFPAPTLEATPGLPMKTARTQPTPPEIPDTGHCIGVSVHNGYERAVFLSVEDRRRHVYAVGQTGTGKTTMFESMILDDIRGGEGVCVIDPHGDLIEKLLAKIPERRAADVVLIDPADTARPIGFNVLEYETEAQKYFLVQEIISIVEAVMERFDPNMMGPMFFQHVRMNLLLVMSNPKMPGTLLQFYQIFNSNSFYKNFLPLPNDADPILRKFVDEVLPKQNYATVRCDGSSMGGYISSKFADFVSDPMLRNIFGQRRSTINLREIMDTGKILLVNLSKGRLGEINSRMFGMFLVAKLQAAAMGRANLPMHKRRDFYLYVDEFQNIATSNFGTLLSEARKYRLNLILTNQYVTQIAPRISAAISGNVGTLISFRVGVEDAELLAREFLPVFNQYDLMQLPNFTACVSVLVGGQVSRPFTMQNRMDALPLDEKRITIIKNLSRRKYGRERGEVEREIAESLFDKEKI
jgi:hypothetical protein